MALSTPMVKGMIATVESVKQTPIQEQRCTYVGVVIHDNHEAVYLSVSKRQKNESIARDDTVR